MATVYASDDQLVARYPSLTGKDADERDAVLEEASRWIDARCHRRFWLDDTATTRVFKATHRYLLDLGKFEIGSADDVVVKVDDGSGTFATTLPSSDYVLEPVNATVEARPFTQIRLLVGCWPLVYSEQGRQELVQVTAKYGWPAVPASVREACLILANEEFENPGGLAGESIDGYSWRGAAGDGLPSGIRSALRKIGLYVRGWAA